MDSAPTPPPQGNRHLPPEMVEEILFNLPLKSLLRFTSVSKSWNSLIWEPRFARKHMSCAVLLRRSSLVIYINFLNGVSTIGAFSSIKLETESLRRSFSFVFDPEGPIEHTTDFAAQFEKKPYLRALCDELWCVEVGDDLFLWNPSIKNYRKLPPPLFKFRQSYEFVYGLGYDHVGHDYKILKIGRDPSVETELYSLKNNCWRKIESYCTRPEQERCEFVGGRFHWINTAKAKTPAVIVSFNLSTKNYEEMALPKFSAKFGESYDIEVVVLRGKLCVFLNYHYKYRFELWVMEEYGVEKSWTKKFDFRGNERIKPVYYYDNGDILVKEYNNNKMDIVLYEMKKGKISWLKVIVYCSYRSSPDYKGDAFLYVETLISPSALLSSTVLQTVQ